MELSEKNYFDDLTYHYKNKNSGKISFDNFDNDF